MKNKYFLIVLCLILVGLLITGCGNSKNDSSSSSEEKTSSKKKYDVEYLKMFRDSIEENYDSNIDVAIVDFNNDSVPELVIKNDDYYDSVAFINSDGEVAYFTFADGIDSLCLLVKFEDDSEKWYQAVANDDGLCLEDFADGIKTGELSCKEENYFKTEASALRKYYNLEAYFKYFEVDINDVLRGLKDINNGELCYGTNKKHEDAKIDNDEDNAKHRLTCNYEESDVETFYNIITFDNNEIVSIEDGVIAEFKDEISKEREKEILKGLSEENDGSVFQVEHSGKTYNFYTYLDKSEYMSLIFDDEEDDLTYDNIDAIIKSFEDSDYTCELDY